MTRIISTAPTTRISSPQPVNSVNVVSPQATFGPDQNDNTGLANPFGLTTTKADDGNEGIATLYYNFRSIYGTDPLGNPLINQITSQQEQDVRDIFTLWGHYLGVQFVETADQGLTIATGDTRAVTSYIDP